MKRRTALDGRSSDGRRCHARPMTPAATPVEESMRTARNRLAVLRSLSNQKCTFRTVSKTVMRRRSQALPDASFACSLAEATDDASKADVLGAKLDASLQPAGGGGDDAPPSTLPQPRPLAVAGAVVEAVAAPPRRMLAVAEEADAEAGEGSCNGTGNLLSSVSYSFGPVVAILACGL